MVIDMIIENIIGVNKYGDIKFKETKDNWIDYLDYWKDKLGDYMVMTGRVSRRV